MALRRFVYVLSKSPKFKVPELQLSFDRYGITVLSHPPTEDQGTIRALLQGEHISHEELKIAENDRVRVLSVLNESTRLFKHGTTEPPLMQTLERVDDTSTLSVTTLQKKTDTLNTKDYSYRTEGYLDMASRTDSSSVFGWDDVFHQRAVHKSYHDLKAQKLKHSSRDMVISQYIRDKLYYKRAVNLKFNPQKQERSVDFTNYVSDFVSGNKYLNTPEAEELGIVNMYTGMVNEGVFFRGAKNRREKTYWLPGLNAGVPFTPKRDEVHEITFMTHDFGHFTVPDLVYTGQNSEMRRRVYTIWRMCSEAVTMSMADMVFVDSLRRTRVEYDYSKRKIFPLLQDAGIDLSVKEDAQSNIRALLNANVRYCLLGDDSAYTEMITQHHETSGKSGAPCFANLNLFKEKYMPFFVEDFRWTQQNYRDISSHADEYRRWWDLASPVATAHGLHLETVDDCLNALGLTEADVTMPLPELVTRIFDRVLATRLEPAWLSPTKLTMAPKPVQLSRAFARYTVGQLALFSRFHFAGDAHLHASKIVDYMLSVAPGSQLPPAAAAGGAVAGGAAASSPASSSEVLTQDNVEAVRSFYEGYVRDLQQRNLITQDDASTYKEVFPLFEPFYVFYDAGLEAYQQLDDVSTSILLHDQ